jgi:tetratricopeptide (TPR) repeat protein
VHSLVQLLENLYLSAMNDAKDLLNHHQASWERLIHLLQPEGDAAPLLLVGIEQPADRDGLLEALVPATPELEHLLLDLSQEQVHSLVEVLNSRFADLLSDSLDQAVRRTVHVVHLEHTLLQEILQGKGKLLDQLETERESLRSGFPFRLILWVDVYLWRRLEHEAPQLWALLSDHFAFFRQETDHPTDQVYLRLLELVAQTREQKTPDPELTYQIGHILEEKGLVQAGLDHYQQVLEADVPEALKLKVKEGMAHLYEREGEAGEAAAAYQEALDLSGPQSTEAARLHEQQGALYLQLQAVEEAMEAFGRALRAFEAQSDEKGQARMHRRLAYGQERKGKLDEAVAHYLQAIELIEAADDPNVLTLAEAYQQVGAIRQNQQRYAEALQAFQDALPYAQATEDDFLTAALEDSVEAMTEMVQRRGKKAEGGEKKRKGLFGRLR